MKIGNPADTPAVPQATTAVAGTRPTPADAGKAQGAGAEPSAITNEPSAQVALSSTASTLMQGATGVSAEFDAEKVARISQSIADGSFKVNPEAIADKLIANAQELLNQTTR